MADPESVFIDLIPLTLSHAYSGAVPSTVYC